LISREIAARAAGVISMVRSHSLTAFLSLS
jgi:hypothetical protein